MVERKGNLNLPDTPELSPQEQFLNRLYKKTLDWLINEQEEKIVASIDPQEIRRWPQEQLLTEKGSNACLEIIQRTSRNAFIQ